MLRRKIAAFMRGRYGSTGIDKLGFFLLITSLVMHVAGWFFRGRAATFAIFGVQNAVLIYFIFRLLSRNYTARQKENRAFCSIFGKVKSWFRLQKDRIKDRGKFVYKKCPECRAVIRLPANKGRHTVKCPKCSCRFDVKNIF